MPACIALRSTDRTPETNSKSPRYLWKERLTIAAIDIVMIGLLLGKLPTEEAMTIATWHNGSVVPLHRFRVHHKTSRTHTIASRLYHETPWAIRKSGSWRMKDCASAANPMQPKSQISALHACYNDLATVSRKYATVDMPVTA